MTKEEACALCVIVRDIALMVSIVASPYFIIWLQS